MVVTLHEMAGFVCEVPKKCAKFGKRVQVLRKLLAKFGKQVRVICQHWVICQREAQKTCQASLMTSKR